MWCPVKTSLHFVLIFPCFVLFFKFFMLLSDLSSKDPAHYGAHSKELWEAVHC